MRGERGAEAARRHRGVVASSKLVSCMGVLVLVSTCRVNRTCNAAFSVVFGFGGSVFLFVQTHSLRHGGAYVSCFFTQAARSSSCTVPDLSVRLLSKYHADARARALVCRAGLSSAGVALLGYTSLSLLWPLLSRASSLDDKPLSLPRLGCRFRLRSLAPRGSERTGTALSRESSCTRQQRTPSRRRSLTTSGSSIP